MITISDRVEKKRLNGHRIPGEFYLVGSMMDYQCCKFPTELSKHSVPQRGLLPMPGHILSADIFGVKCRAGCPAFASSNNHFAGMMWIPEKHYSHAAMFVSEIRTEPVQVRVKKIPANVKIGESWILLAHRKSIVDYSKGMQGWIDSETGEAKTNIAYKPGIFTMFRVDAIEYVMKPDSNGQLTLKGDPIDYLTNLVARGITLVNVLHDEDLEETELDDEKTHGYEN